jgi:hypothetical protein
MWRATPKASTAVVLSSPTGDPVLVQWQYGPGTAVAWTSGTELRFICTDLGFLQQVARTGGGAVLSSARQVSSEPVLATRLLERLRR